MTHGIFLLWTLLMTLSSNLHLSSSKGLIDCETDSFNVTWANVAPYMFVDHKDHKMKGPIFQVTRSIVETCCGSEVQIVLGKQQLSQRAVEEEIGDADLALPVVKTALTRYQGSMEGYMFLPLMETTGGVMLVHKDSLEASPIATSLLGCWPLAVIVIISAFTAGILIWALDQYWNPGDFPKSFLKGGWDGIWWAFVTMTTVGYGDKTPKSIAARLFGLVWMFVGIIIMSIFSATLTSALMSSNTVELQIKGSSVGVRLGSIEEIIASREGASITKFGTVPDIIDAIANRSIEGGLVDINLALYFVGSLEEKNIEFGPDVKYAAVFGILVQNQPLEVEKCFAKVASKSQFSVYDSLLDHLGKYEKKEKEAAEASTETVMSDLEYIILGLGVTLGVLCIACIAWECFYVRPRRKRIQAESGQMSGNSKKTKCGGFCNCDDNNTVDTGVEKDSDVSTTSRAEGTQNSGVKDKNDVAVEELA